MGRFFICFWHCAEGGTVNNPRPFVIFVVQANIFIDQRLSQTFFHTRRWIHLRELM